MPSDSTPAAQAHKDQDIEQTTKDHPHEGAAVTPSECTLWLCWWQSIASKAGGAIPNEEQDQNYQFYKEYCRLYYANIILTNRL